MGWQNDTGVASRWAEGWQLPPVPLPIPPPAAPIQILCLYMCPPDHNKYASLAKAYIFSPLRRPTTITGQRVWGSPCPPPPEADNV